MGHGWYVVKKRRLPGRMRCNNRQCITNTFLIWVYLLGVEVEFTTQLISFREQYHHVTKKKLRKCERTSGVEGEPLWEHDEEDEKFAQGQRLPGTSPMAQPERNAAGMLGVAHEVFQLFCIEFLLLSLSRNESQEPARPIFIDGFDAIGAGTHENYQRMWIIKFITAWDHSDV